MLKPTSSHLQATMAAFLSSLLAGSALLNVVAAQNFGGSGPRDEDAFTYIQPLDTVILTEYGSSPAVYPSRKFLVYVSVTRTRATFLNYINLT
jgi:hypothetical protein